jgi:hypothetical protein
MILLDALPYSLHTDGMLLPGLRWKRAIKTEGTGI